jgi:hypothetical protein
LPHYPMLVPKTNTQTGQSPVDRRALALRDAVRPQQQGLANHPLYARLSSLETVRLFMEHHVFAVWDSMSLLKALQAELSCVQLPWIPKGDPELRRFVNEIVLREESDEDLDGVRSHFETYLLAMWEAGADTRSIDAFLVQLRAGRSVPNALAAAEAPRPARSFVAATWQMASSGEAHRVAAAFALGREELIPDMFLTALDHLDQSEGGCLQRFRHYLSRHGELDRQLQGPAALRMLTALCDDEPELWKEAGTAAREALLSRKALWDAILDATNKAGRARGNIQHHGAQGSWPRPV